MKTTIYMLIAIAVFESLTKVIGLVRGTPYAPKRWEILSDIVFCLFIVYFSISMLGRVG